jgi:hypothetical protein
MRRYIAAAFMMITLFIAGFWAHAQVIAPQVPPPPPGPRVLNVSSRFLVLSGDDVGFAVSYWEGSRPVGRWVVRGNDGQWVEPIIQEGGTIRKRVN